MSDAEKLVALSTEVWLKSWTENDAGRFVRFELPPGDGDTAHPMAAFYSSKKKGEGKRFQMVLVEIGDDEKPVVQQRLSQRAAVLCKDRQFWQWAAERSLCDINSEEDARSWLLSGCRIVSRSQFDTSKQAADWLQTCVLIPYEAYLNTVSKNII
jgi:hypothetical protein